MKLFSPLYTRVVGWASHRHAERYLGALSFAESSFFPIPPDVLLAPMTLARPERGWWFALLTTLTSVIGGIAGYLIGWFGLDLVEPLLRSAGYWDAYERSVEQFQQWGFLAVLAAGFTPIPYKIFTISAGALNMLLPVFILASFLGRGARFFLVAGIIVWGGAPMEKRLRQNVDLLGWLAIVAIVAIYLFFRLR